MYPACEGEAKAGVRHERVCKCGCGGQARGLRMRADWEVDGGL